MMRFPFPEDFVLWHLASTPRAAAVAAAGAQARESLIQDVRAALRSYIDDDGLSVPMEAHVATGTT